MCTRSILLEYTTLAFQLMSNRPKRRRSAHNRFLRINGANNRADGSAPCGAHQLPPDWAWERFLVVDAGNGQIALHNRSHNRFLRGTDTGDVDGSSPCDAFALPREWAWERWSVVDAGNGQIALYNRALGKFLRIKDNIDADLGSPCGEFNLPRDWAWERFTVTRA